MGARVISCLAAVASLGLLGCSRNADYEALCAVESRCTGEDVAVCVDYHQRVAARETRCKEEERDLVACMVRDQGAICETEGGARLVPSVLCRDAEAKSERCLADPSTPGTPVSYEEALRAFCDAPKHVESAGNPADRAAALARHIEAHATNDRFIALLARASSDGSGERDRALRAALAEVGITSCLMLDERGATPPSAP